MKIIHPALDAGGKNDFALKLGIENFIESDLNNYFYTLGKYKTITSFEVLEHLQNPLLYLKSIYNCLDENGILYLTTPINFGLDMLKGEFHFHEFNEYELMFCLHEAGFKDVKIKRIKTYILKNYGIRPIIRKLRDMLYGQTFYVEAKK